MWLGKTKDDKKVITRRLLRRYLERREFDKLEEWAGTEKNALTKIMPFLFEKDELLLWRAIEAMGKVGRVVFEKNPELVKDTIRKLLWSMSDESGSVGWHSPEATGEILYNVPALLGEYGVILASHINLPPFERGVHWAVMRMAGVDGKLFSDFADVLERSAECSDPYIRAWALKALSLICPERRERLLKRVKADGEKIHFYDFLSGKIVQKTVKEFVE